MKNKRTTKPNLYSVSMMEENGQFKILEANKHQPINQFRSVLKRVNARNLGKQIRNGKIVN